MKRYVLAFWIAIFTIAPAGADTGDYMWNQRFEKKKLAAEKGNASAQYQLGNMYLKGRGTPQNHTLAREWFEKSAKQGHKRGQYKLAMMLYKGEGGGQDNAAAAEWFGRSAEQDYPPAQYYLAKLYADGLGVTQSMEQAIVWMERAEQNGYGAAKTALGRLRAKQSTSARAEPGRAEPRPAHKTAKPKPATPKPAPQRSSARKKKAGDYREILLSENWVTFEGPSLYLASDITKCATSGNAIRCVSEQQTADEDYGLVNYTVETSVEGISDQGRFSPRFRWNVSLILPSDPDDPDLAIPINYGPQPEQYLDCEFVEDRKIKCSVRKTKQVVMFVGH